MGKVFPLNRAVRTVDITNIPRDILEHLLEALISGELTYEEVAEAFPGPIVVVEEFGVDIPDIPEDSD